MPDRLDITPQVISALGNALDRNAEKILPLYKDFVDIQIEYFDALDRTYNGNIDFDKSFRAQIRDISTPSELLAKLGDDRAGSQGRLHILNALFWHIALPPLLFSEILPEIDRNALAGSTLAFSPQTPKGCVFTTIIAVYKNPLDDKIEELEKALAEMEDRVDAEILEMKTTLNDTIERVEFLEGDVLGALDELREAFGDDGVIRGELSTINRRLGEVAGSANTALSDLASHKRLIEAIDGKIGRI